MLRKIKSYFGPSTLVTAAFIGPGTLTTCTLAGVETGFEMLWVLIFAIFATIVLQEMSARLGFTTQKGLGEALSMQITHRGARVMAFFLVIGAILIGNAAYEAGNISGGILGVELLFFSSASWPLLIGICCFILLYFGGYKWAEKILITLVIVMSLCFTLTAILLQPNWTEVVAGLIPTFPSENQLIIVLGLIGTTIVPYNLFLHASAVSQKYSSDDSISELRRENRTAIILGGLISMMIVITAGTSRQLVNQVSNAADLAIQLSPIMGSISEYLVGIGLLAAGISSALTAPLAAAYAAKGLFGWQGNEKSNQFRAVWMSILFIGVLVAMTDLDRILVIYFAQITNAVLLPLIAIFLLFVCNSKALMGQHTNGLKSNIYGSFVIVVCLLLSFKSVYNLL